MDRKRLVEVVCAGRAEIGNDLYGKGYTYYPDGLEQRERDVAEARRLLKRTGLYNKKVTFYTSTAAANFLGLGLDPTSPDWGVVIAASREALFVQPSAVLAPTLMLVMFTVGVNLLADGLLPHAGRTGRKATAWNQ
ncbi:hypothetical protein [Streptomyces sp. NPDC004629]|uniref:hypothetical protein n=1 Tax=Streptomyces sp. NPDC004629 TaxID=3364705 RepID=UPI0036D02F82